MKGGDLMEKSKTCVYKIRNLITGLLLCDKDFRVMKFESEHEAMDFLKNSNLHSERFAVICTDFCMRIAWSELKF